MRRFKALPRFGKAVLLHGVPDPAVNLPRLAASLGVTPVAPWSTIILEAPILKQDKAVRIAILAETVPGLTDDEIYGILKDNTALTVERAGTELVARQFLDGIQKCVRSPPSSSDCVTLIESFNRGSKFEQLAIMHYLFRYNGESDPIPLMSQLVFKGFSVTSVAQLASMPAMSLATLLSEDLDTVDYHKLINTRIELGLRHDGHLESNLRDLSPAAADAIVLFDHRFEFATGPLWPLSVFIAAVLPDDEVTLCSKLLETPADSVDWTELDAAAESVYNTVFRARVAGCPAARAAGSVEVCFETDTMLQRSAFALALVAHYADTPPPAPPLE